MEVAIWHIKVKLNGGEEVIDKTLSSIQLNFPIYMYSVVRSFCNKSPV